MAQKYLPTYAQGVIAIYDESYNLLLEEAKIVKDTVSKDSKTMTHPIESGELLSDHKILNPIEIQVPVIIYSDNYKDLYNEINDLYVKSTYVIIQTRVALFKKMYLTKMPHEEDVSMFDAVTIGLNFKEAQIETAETVFVTSSNNNKSTTKKGEQQPKTKSILAATFDWFSK